VWLLLGRNGHWLYDVGLEKVGAGDAGLYCPAESSDRGNSDAKKKAWLKGGRTSLEGKGFLYDKWTARIGK